MEEVPVTTLIGINDIEAAQKALDEMKLTAHTPMLYHCDTLSSRLSEKCPQIGSLHFKLESLQKMGCFKTRGVANVMHEIKKTNLDAVRKAGMVTMSAGNFAKTFSYVAAEQQIPAFVFMPEDVPLDRVATARKYGSQVFLVPRKDLQENVDRMIKEKGTIYAHPFDDFTLIAGYSTIAAEILQDLPDVDIVIVGVGGGGLISGVAAGLKELSKDTRKDNPIQVIGVEPSGAPSMYLSLQQDKPVTLEKITTFVNGLSPPYAGTRTFHHIKKYVDKVVLVEDDEVRYAMKLLFEDYKLVVESAGAACVASLLFNKIADVKGKKICCLISGGNISSEELNTQLKSCPLT